MKYKILVLGFTSSVIMMVLLGFYAIHMNQQLLTSFDDKEKHFKDIATAATEVSSYAKRAEGHLFLYLMLHDRTDKEKFPQRIASLHENIAILDKIIANPDARAILQKIKANIGENLSIGNALMAEHDKGVQDSGEFLLEAHQEAILKLHNNFSKLRKLGVELSTLEISLEDAIRTEIFTKAVRLRANLLLFIALTAFLTIFTGYVLGRMIIGLKKENTIRIQSEQAIELERNKLQEALAEIKVLSGLLPICAVCKKIRDDNGYWNQIESYLSKHSDVEFSHGICQECVKKHYPEYYGEEEPHDK